MTVLPRMLAGGVSALPHPPSGAMPLEKPYLITQMQLEILAVDGASRRMMAGLAFVIAAIAPIVSAGEPTRTETVMLSGTSREDAVPWEFRCDDGNNSGKWTTIAVPSCWEQEGFGRYHYGQVEGFPSVVTGIYRRRFNLEPLAGRRVRLCFEGVMTDATVKVNGRSAGPTHQGGFSPFNYDVTPLVRAGENEIEVVVTDQSADPGVNRSERFADFWVFGGIHRPVFLEILPAQFIERVAIDAQHDGAFRMDVFVGEAGEADRITAQVVDAQGRTVGRVMTANAGARVRLESSFPEVKPWTPETPDIYRVEVALEKTGRVLHRLSERFGFRTFEVLEGQGFRLNGSRILLKGVCRPSFRPETARTLSARHSIEDVKLMKAMNANAVRAVHYPCDRHFLDTCDELGLLVMTEYLAWMSPLPDGPGKRLVRELVTRDHNHPSIVLWANGNHKAFNPVLELEFKVHDLQDRRALRTEPKISGDVPKPARSDVVPVETRMYPNFAQLTERLRQPYPVLPVESLHALYDGGGGAGLAEFWREIERSPVGGGLFIWEFVDEAVARADEGGKLDSAGNRSADGLVGPHHEKEAGYYVARDVFAPVQIDATDVGPGRAGSVRLQNKFFATDLSRVRFVRHLVQVGEPPTRQTTELPAPRCAPGAAATLDLALAAEARGFDYVLLEAFGTDGGLLRDWSWPLRTAAAYLPRVQAGTLAVAETPDRIEVRAGGRRFLFERSTGRLIEVWRGETRLPMHHGPDLVWSAPSGNVLPAHLRDGVARTIPTATRKKSAPASLPGRLTAAASGASPVEVRKTVDRCEIVARNSRGFERLVWAVFGDGTLRLDFAYRLEGVFDSYGISFDCEPGSVRSVTWLGRGPHPIWRNRMDGAAFGLWRKPNRRTVPGEVFDYPAFAGCHADTRWYQLDGDEGRIRVWLESSGLVARWFTPEWGATPVNATAALPPGELSFLHLAPAIGDKWMPPADVSPSGRPVSATGVHTGSLWFRFEPPGAARSGP